MESKSRNPAFSPTSPRAVRGRSLPLARHCSGQNYLCYQGSPPAQNRHLHCSRSIFQGRCRNAYAIRAVGSARSVMRQCTSVVTGDGAILEVTWRGCRLEAVQLFETRSKEIPDLHDGCQSATSLVGPIRTQEPRSPAHLLLDHVVVLKLSL